MKPDQRLTAARRCIGFGEHEGLCSYSATVHPALLWCQRCEALRVEHVTEQMGALAGSFRRPDGSTTQWFGDGKAHGALEHHRSQG